jgi:hypothetical protein
MDTAWPRSISMDGGHGRRAATEDITCGTAAEIRGVTVANGGRAAAAYLSSANGSARRRLAAENMNFFASRFVA